ncbi:hypothetical protein AAHE18_04G182700 [Arachis hypogaea]
MMLSFFIIILVIRLLHIVILKSRSVENSNTLLLSQNQENIKTMGLPMHVINSYHTFPHVAIANNIVVNNCDATTCCICISDYGKFEILRMMPQCGHYFHRDCLDLWLKVNGSCPLCRDSPLQG